MALTREPITFPCLETSFLMKTTSKRSPSRAVPKIARAGRPLKSNGAATAPRPVVPLNERRLRFGDKWVYAPAPETFDYISLAPRHELSINEKFTPPSGGGYFDSINPATEDTLSEVNLPLMNSSWGGASLM